jgi:outer membrane protein assembly factor BamB
MKRRPFLIFMVYNSAVIMGRHKRLAAIVILSLALAACAGPVGAPLVDPVPLRLPLDEVGSLAIEGRVVGQPRSRDGVFYFAERDGWVTAVVVPSRSVLWRFKADYPVSSGPELGQGHVLVRDDANVLYALDRRGAAVLEKRLDEDVTTAVREDQGRAVFGTADGKILALDIAGGGALAWVFGPPVAAAAITAGPIFAGDLAFFGRSDGGILALDRSGRPAWERQVKGACRVDPVFDRGRLYFGTEDGYFYCLKAATGKKVWSRRLQGASAQSALVVGRRLAVAASNSVVFLLAGRGGSILSWEAVPSRILHELAAAGDLILVSSAAPEIGFLDSSSGKFLGRHAISGPAAAGALWIAPFVVLVEEDEDTDRQRLSFLRTRTTPAMAKN